MSENAERDADQARETEETGSAAQAAAEQTTDGAEAGTGTANSVGTDPLDELRRQLNDQREKYLRLAAEFDNFRKRATRERTEAASRGQAELARQLIEPLDDLARFAHLDPSTVDASTVVEGAAMVERKLLKNLGAVGLSVINPVDETFDPNLHEAVTTEPAASAEDDHVVSRVFQVGYVFNGQLLRPARVVVKQWNG